MSGLGDYHGQMAEDTRPRPERYSLTSLGGLELESTVRREVLGGNLQWELTDMQQLFTALHAAGYCVIVEGSAVGGWTAYAKYADMIAPGDDQVVVETADVSPAIALARAAVAAVRYWPKAQRGA